MERTFNRKSECKSFEFYEDESYDYIDEEMEEPTLHELQEITRNLKTMKTPGPDNINVDVLQAACPQMTQRIQELVFNTWRY